MINLGGEVGCMISEGPWIFVGILNMVKVRKKIRSPAFVFSQSGVRVMVMFM